MRTLFLQAPSFDGFDGGAGSRYQAKREIKSFWYPTWLAQPAALVENSKLIDAPPHKTSLAEVVAQAKDFDLVVAHTSVPSFKSDVKVIEALKAANPEPQGRPDRREGCGQRRRLAARRRRRSISSPATNSTSRSRKSPTAMPWGEIKGISYRNKQGVIVHNEDRPMIENMDSLPFVTPVYKRDLVMENYFIGYLKHPYISIYTGRGCKSRCTFCLWPQTVGGHTYRTRSVGHVIEEIKWAMKAFPADQGILLRRRHLHRQPAARRSDREGTGQARRHMVVQCQGQRAVQIAEEAARMAACACCSSVMNPATSRSCTTSRRACASKSPSSSPRIATNSASRSTARSFWACRAKAKETIRETVEFAKRINPHTIQVSLAAPYPGTFLYNQAVQNGWLDAANAELVDDSGIQIAPLHYPHLSHNEIFNSLEGFYREFYFRPEQDRLHRRRNGDARPT